MSNSHSNEISEFCLEGRFLDFVIKDGFKLKGLLLATSEGECYVKLAKHLRVAFDWRLPPGTWLQVMGDKKYDRKTGEVKLKAQQVMAARRDANRENFPASSCPRLPASSSTDVKAKPAKATILVCQKSDCVKRGADGLCQALQGALRDRGLADQVTIKATGCMKNCKAGPNLVMPDKTRYSRIQATQVPALMEKHFADSSVNQKQENVRKVAMPISSTATI
ncbi:MAG: (2Fe-2S) ferredoxin domain-containing protein [Chlorogloeopsis fritschii C42_A2020_084]|uniref:(2Fe-2S) ferredoxin domain-containing protein n=1 Tax=Chlorogloeopsis fritschii TaxID=1124 RepID=UPI0019E24F60|nr:(2Fe-2S) ferredoxin domain-containing protein [Chlorogloeopsis fritschii]MBF2006922.1 (2Fe-2S) ferredoxin domain-containing protein [Chlorogloeopsis fritschii C42_A2020_084]